MVWQDTLPARPAVSLAGHRVAVYASGGAPAHHLALLALWGAKPRVIHAEEIAAGGLDDFDAVIFPGGGLAAMAGQLNPLGENGIKRVRDWVEDGGTYVGTCAGSCHPLRMSDPYLEALPVAAGFAMCDLTPLNAAAGAWGLDSPGTGRLLVEPADHPLLAGLTAPFEIVHYNGPLFPPAPGSAGRVLEPTAFFTPFELSAGSEARPTTIERAVTAGARVAHLASFASGRVVLFGSHPEFGANALQLGWLPASRLLANALALVQPRGEAVSTAAAVDRAALDAAAGDARELQAVLTRLSPLAEQMPPEAPAFLGQDAATLWREAVTESLAILEPLAEWLESRPADGAAEAAFLLDSEPRPNQDFGFAGVRQLLSRALEMARTAEAIPLERWPEFTGPYDQFLEHPYHLIASVYLSAGGLIASAGLQATAFAASNDLPDPGIVPLAA